MIFKFKRSKTQCRSIFAVRECGIITREHHCWLEIHHTGPHRGGGLIWALSADDLIRQDDIKAQAEQPKIFLLGK